MAKTRRPKNQKYTEIEVLIIDAIRWRGFFRLPNGEQKRIGFLTKASALLSKKIDDLTKRHKALTVKENDMRTKGTPWENNESFLKDKLKWIEEWKICQKELEKFNKENSTPFSVNSLSLRELMLT